MKIIIGNVNALDIPTIKAMLSEHGSVFILASAVSLDHGRGVMRPNLLSDEHLQTLLAEAGQALVATIDKLTEIEMLLLTRSVSRDLTLTLLSRAIGKSISRQMLPRLVPQPAPAQQPVYSAAINAIHEYQTQCLQAGVTPDWLAFMLNQPAP